MLTGSLELLTFKANNYKAWTFSGVNKSTVSAGIHLDTVCVCVDALKGLIFSPSI